MTEASDELADDGLTDEAAVDDEGQPSLASSSLAKALSAARDRLLDRSLRNKPGAEFLMDMSA